MRIAIPSKGGSNALVLSPYNHSIPHRDAPHISPIHVQTVTGNLLSRIYGDEVPAEKCNRTC